jgi:DNA-binding transcriptional LysR family regulator
MPAKGRIPNLNHLRVFESIAATGSAARAAGTVNRSPPAVTLAIRKLEAFFGATLFERGRRGSYPTEIGRIVLPRVERLFREFDDALLHAVTGQSSLATDRLLAIRSKLSLASINGLIAVAENDSLDSAARSISLSKNSLYRIAREFERVLGRSCFEHAQRGLTANGTGAELARRFSLGLREIDLALEEVKMAQGVARSRIAIGARRTCAMKPLSGAVREFLGRYPGSHVRVADGPYDQLLVDLRHGRLDMVYGSLRGGARTPVMAADLAQEALFHDPYAITVRAGHPLTRKRHVQLADLARYDWILSNRGSPRRDVFEALFKGFEISPTSSIETSSLEFQLAMIASSDCITLMTSREAREQAGAGVLTTIDVAGMRSRLHDGVTTRLNWKPTSLQMDFVALLRKHAHYPDVAG